MEQLAGCGLHLPLDEVMAKFVGRTRQGCIDHATELLGGPLPDGFATRWDAALFGAFERELKAIEGVAELLQALEIPYCVASNSSPERMRISLKAAGLLSRFEGRRFSAAEVANPKPAPDLFLHAAQKMGAKPVDCVVIEDTPTGVRAGVAAGMRVLGYAGGVPAQAEKLRAAGALPFHAMGDVAGQIAAM
jgi:HAD superfamily hydrolase (TIGR01509 family)